MTKVLISLGPSVDGYININPLEGKSIYDLSSLEPSSCWEIVADGLIDYIPLREMVPILSHWCSRLRHKGKIVVGGTDALELSRRYFVGEITTLEFNEAVHGKQDSPWGFKHGQANLPEITEVLKGFGMKIIKKRLDKHNFLIEAERQ